MLKSNVVARASLSHPPNTFMQNYSPKVRRLTSALGSISSVALAMGMLSLAASNVGAQQSDGKWSVGMGAFTVQKVYKDIERENLAPPFLAYENKWISFAGPRLDVKFPSDDALSFRLRVAYFGDGYNTNSSPVFAGMEDRKRTVWGGGAVVWRSPIANVSAEVLSDLQGYSNGTRAAVRAEHRFGFGRFGVSPRAGVQWFDSKYVDYYYGVKASEARAGRAAYQGQATYGLDAGLRFDYTPVLPHTVFLDVNTVQYGSEILNSPLVDKPTQISVSVGYLYRF
jgi:outer membrane protein